MALVRTDALEDRIAFIRVTVIGEVGTAPVVTRTTRRHISKGSVLKIYLVDEALTDGIMAVNHKKVSFAFVDHKHPVSRKI
jgi:hypothetical protein